MSALILAGAILFSILTGQGGQVYEDNPLWDCHTMGNHICGPEA